MSDSEEAGMVGRGEGEPSLSPWQLAKRIAVASACAERRAFTVDGEVELRLEAEAA